MRVWNLQVIKKWCLLPSSISGLYILRHQPKTFYILEPAFNNFTTLHAEHVSCCYDKDLIIQTSLTFFISTRSHCKPPIASLQRIVRMSLKCNLQSSVHLRLKFSFDQTSSCRPSPEGESGQVPDFSSCLLYPLLYECYWLHGPFYAGFCYDSGYCLH